ncbi:L-carnitine dehydratase/bile acid-inducible protein F [Thermosulfidibacter takaii ABI70S6]|uniref:L-carnitine dehydratase/bile acid-inducible protein F n=1 Tax=Thermosulfidibacter takaii (strain DSM 17441 / JCM 13301 / NBRC 103674 / ABI70S6) TaxID=1298851 RepID=A0A0S3QTE9_THET7|nr:CoA transferase [Thermosulfidibacter takaii]BAT71580.1 L-carnitine dehydratase/bile acid-inducible protein F [Thermosulfidibacter takaii ABI70S6]
MEWKVWAQENTDHDKNREKPEALDGLVVMDVSYGSFAGLVASSLLAEMGAFVVRVEPPKGDITRKMSPYGMKVKDAGLAYIVEGRNKYHVTLNLENSKGREIFEELIAKVDVLIETFPSGQLKEWDLDWEKLKGINEKLIMCSLKTFGETGYAVKEGDMPKSMDYDVVDQARSGFMWTVGIPEDYDEFPEHTRVPTRMGNWMAHYAGGTMAAFAIMAALIHREFTGEGQHIDISPAEALMAMNNYALHYYHLTGEIINRTANFEPAAYAYNYFQAKDGMVFIAGYADPNWKALCSIINRPDLVEKYPTLKDRTNPKNFVPMTREVEKFLKQYTREEIVKIWLDYDGPGVTVAGEVLKPVETMKFDHWYERKALIEFDDKDYGKLLVQGLVAKMTETPPRLKWLCRPVGADNQVIYKQLLGYDQKILEQLKKEGVI